jgi:hypothetical protein
MVLFVNTHGHWARYLIVVPGRIVSQGECHFRVLRFFSRRGLLVHSAEK